MSFNSPFSHETEGQLALWRAKIVNCVFVLWGRMPVSFPLPVLGDFLGSVHPAHFLLVCALCAWDRLGARVMKWQQMSRLDFFLVENFDKGVEN